MRQGVWPLQEAQPLESSMQGRWCQEGRRRRRTLAEAGYCQEISGQVQSKAKIQSRHHRVKDGPIRKGSTF